MRHVRIEVPVLPLSENYLRRKHWSVRNREAKSWRDNISIWAPRRGGPYWDGAPIDPAVVTIIFQHPGSRKRDADNMVKRVVDAVVWGGYLVDDSPDHVRELRLRVQRGEPRTIVLIEETT